MFEIPLGVVWLVSWIAALATMPSVLLRREGHPLSALSWLLALFAFPPIALLAWWAFGRTHLQRKKRRRRLASAHISQQIRAMHPSTTSRGGSELGGLAGVRLPAFFGEYGFQVSRSNRARLLLGPSRAYEAWERAIEQATDHVHAIFFIWRDDSVGARFRDLLIRKAGQGVEVRVVVDGVGSSSLPRRYFRDLVRCGGLVHRFMRPRILSKNPILNFRNHRKLLIVDGRVGFVGGVNIDEKCLGWSDLAVEIRGPAVGQLQEVFADDWFFCSDEALLGERYFRAWGESVEESGRVSCATIASGPDQRWNAIREMLFLTINSCRRRFWLMTPYFIPDGAIVLALRTAVYRGVDVRILLPAASDVPLVKRAARAFYPELVEVGIKVCEYPGMAHAKAALCDESLILVGSANLDIRSFRLNFEISAFLGSEDLARELAAFFEESFDKAHGLTAAEIEARTPAGRVLDAAAHLLSPLL